MKKKYLSLALLLTLFSKTVFAAIDIVAAENVYGNLAKTIGGSNVQVTSILNNPNQDPHLFSASPSTAQAIARARIIIYNGIGYDPWATRLLDARGGQTPLVIVVADVVGKKSGDNPHLWYDPTTIPKIAIKLTEILEKIDPTHQIYYQQQLKQVEKENKTLNKKIFDFRKQFHDIPVIATEPVFGYLSDALGLNMHGQDFQLSVMNDVPPSPQQTADFENDLKNHTVKILIYNNQVINPVTERMKNLAEQMHIPIVGVSETEPPNQTYWQWMGGQLDTLSQALR